MDVGGHQVAHRRVHRAMPRDRVEPGERIADHFDIEVPAPVARPGMTGGVVANILCYDALRSPNEASQYPNDPSERGR